MPCRKYFDYFIKSFSHIFLYPRNLDKKKKERITQQFINLSWSFYQRKVIYGSTIRGHINNVYIAKWVFHQICVSKARIDKRVHWQWHVFRFLLTMHYRKSSAASKCSAMYIYDLMSAVVRHLSSSIMQHRGSDFFLERTLYIK